MDLGHDRGPGLYNHKNPLILSDTCVKEQKGEAQLSFDEGAMHGVTNWSSERPNFNDDLFEEVFSRKNMQLALHRVISNRGSAGVDGMDVKELPNYLRDNWSQVKEQLLAAKYQPQPVKRVEIPKPNGGVRRLGIPTVLDRLIQQALQRAGFGVVVDIDLEKFFDRVNHDKLMGKIAKDIKDKRVLKLIRSFLNSGVMENGLIKPSLEGTPQGGPLSPLLSNIVLDTLDKELERRGHKFVRYGDDCNIYVKSLRAGERVMKGVCSFIKTELKLVVNQEKSAVRLPHEVKFLGFSFSEVELKIRIHDKSIKRFKDKVREITRGTRGVAIRTVIADLDKLLKGWRGYFHIYEDRKSMFKDLDSWVRRRLRCYIWQQWKTFSAKRRWLLHFGVSNQWATVTAASSRGDWWCSNTKAMKTALSTKFFDRMGLPRLHQVGRR